MTGAETAGPKRSKAWAFLLAPAVAGLLAALAPDPWPEGTGAVRLSWRDRLVGERPIEVGRSDEVAVGGTVAEGVLTATFPRGVSPVAPTEARVTLQGDGGAVRPALGDLRLEVVLPDGRVERVPGVAWNEGNGALEARRRPPVRAPVVLGLLGLVVVLWVTEAVGTWVTALLVPVVLAGSGAARADAALAPFFHPIIALFFGGFLLAEAMRRVGLDRRVAVTLVSVGGRSPAALFASLIGLSAFLSLWMSNTAATALLLPIALAVTAPLAHRGYTKACVLAIAYAATIGGVGSAIGTPANPLAIEMLSTFAGRRVTFAGWFAFGLPMLLAFLPLMGAWLWWRSGARVDPGRSPRRAPSPRRSAGAWAVRSGRRRPCSSCSRAPWRSGSRRPGTARTPGSSRWPPRRRSRCWEGSEPKTSRASRGRRC
jgi:hypothetical protein